MTATLHRESIVLDVMHDTTYRYAGEVSLAHHVAYLRPLATPYQRVDAFRLGVAPTPATQRDEFDVYGNARTYFSLDQPHTRLAVRAVSRVRVTSRYGDFDAVETMPWEEAAAALEYRSSRPFRPETEFSFPSPFVPRHRELGQYAMASFPRGRPIAQAAVDLMHRVHHDFRYESDATEISTPVLEAFNTRRGVCQDFAHVMIGCLRALGLAARYVSGYLLTRPAPGRPRLIGADASHAWVSAWCPRPRTDTGFADGCWLDLDPTNDVVPSISHVTLALGRDFGDVSPLHGIIRGGGTDHTLAVGVTVRPVGELAR